MKTRPSLTLAPWSVLLLTACNKGTPLPGGYAIFIPAGDDSMMLVYGKRLTTTV